MAVVVSGQWMCIRTLGRGAWGVVVSLAAADASDALFAVKCVSARGAEGWAAMRARARGQGGDTKREQEEEGGERSAE